MKSTKNNKGKIVILLISYVFFVSIGFVLIEKYANTDSFAYLGYILGQFTWIIGEKIYYSIKESDKHD
tara:strand:- start:47 stop:250 length:204 start_codon:yes stop_codon:yes gene_type:complete